MNGRAVRGALNLGSILRVAARRRCAAAQFLQAGLQHLEYRCAAAVRLLVIDQRAQLRLFEHANPVPQIAKTKLVVIRQWQFAGC
ncbi:hypothetical protein BHQ23_02990 [Mycobacterium gordonae]|uniref:Uncharacterized protein n=1 Tax=Mycobacterium gordonae TaxID=1778 RepID=A0A1A6BE67_MYCGO|nr:hypothetical protein A9W98_24220 [Mycobacterium gordonae]ODR23838.1 hypothetical protein BHQ23_02990 [Mycobacterium gordonae]ORV88157.1 hypothetical protein AWC08_22640 [Mycobacterium gordonae]